MNKVSNIIIENARIGFKNFAGRLEKFNPAGNRNFCVFFDYDLGKQLEEDGWNIRWLTAQEEGDSDTPYLQVSISYGPFPPTIFLVTKNFKELLDESLISILDTTEFDNVDIVIRPYTWEVNGKSGIKAYVKSMYAVVAEDSLSRKYDDIPDSVATSENRKNGR